MVVAFVLVVVGLVVIVRVVVVVVIVVVVALGACIRLEYAGSTGINFFVRAVVDKQGRIQCL